MENQAPYRVAFVATPPAPGLTYEQFSQQAQAQVAALGAQYLTGLGLSERPAHTHQGQAVPALRYYLVQVWDSSRRTSTKPLGQLTLNVEAETPEAALALLATKLAALPAHPQESTAYALAA